MKISKKDWIYDNYKEPLKPIEKGYGFYGVVIRSRDGEFVRSNLDGLFYKSINNAHVKKGGFSSVGEYKKFYGIGARTPLMGTTLLTNNRQQAEARYLATSPEELLRRRNKGLFTIKARKTLENRKGTHIALEHRNKKGTCPDQLLDKIKKVAEKVGHSPSTNDFRAEYGTKFLGTIYFHYGSWVNAVKLAGYKPLSETTREKNTLEELIQKLKLFFEKEKRTPLSSDFGTGILPDRRIYSRRFGTLNAARATAKIPLVIHTYGKTRTRLDIRAEQYYSDESLKF